MTDEKRVDTWHLMGREFLNTKAPDRDGWVVLSGPPVPEDGIVVEVALGPQQEPVVSPYRRGDPMTDEERVAKALWDAEFDYSPDEGRAASEREGESPGWVDDYLEAVRHSAEVAIAALGPQLTAEEARLVAKKIESYTRINWTKRLLFASAHRKLSLIANGEKP